jgi:hypothetical protein
MSRDQYIDQVYYFSKLSSIEITKKNHMHRDKDREGNLSWYHLRNSRVIITRFILVTYGPC